MATGNADTGGVEILELPSLQRVKQSEELLAKLYVVEEQPLQRIGSRTINLLITLSLVSVLTFVATLLLRYNSFVVMYEEARSKQANLEAALQRRDNLFGNLVKLTLNHAALEHSIFAHTSDKRTEGMSGGRGQVPAGLEDLIKQGGLQRLLSGGADVLGLSKLMAIVEQYPTIQSAETYKHMMSSLVDMEDRIVTRREEYNTTVAVFNAEITKWPWDYLARLTGFQRMEYFLQKHEADTPVITPELFQQLLPLARVQEVGQ